MNRFAQLLRRKSLAIFVRSTEQAVCIKKEGLALAEFHRGLDELWKLHQSERARGRGDQFALATPARYHERGVTCAHDTGAAGIEIQRNAHRSHERAAAENAPAIVIHRLHDLSWRIVFNRSVVKEQLR